MLLQVILTMELLQKFFHKKCSAEKYSISLELNKKVTAKNAVNNESTLLIMKFIFYHRSCYHHVAIVALQSI